MIFNEETLPTVATLVKPIGTEGGIALRWRNPFSFDSLDVYLDGFVFVAIEGLPVPFRLVALEERNEGEALIRLKGVESPEAARRLVGCELRILAEDIDLGEVYSPEALEAKHLAGHPLVDAKRGKEVGRIEEVLEYSLSVVLRVRGKEGEVLIPFHPDLVERLPGGLGDPLVLRIPEGLEGVS